MDFFEELVVQNPAEQRRAADAKREHCEADGDRPVTHELWLGILRKSIWHLAWQMGSAELGILLRSLYRAQLLRQVECLFSMPISVGMRCARYFQTRKS